MSSVKPLMYPETLTATLEPGSDNNTVNGVCSDIHLRNKSKASSGDIFIFRQYIREFGEEKARFYAAEHDLEIPEGFKSETSLLTDQT